MSSELIKLLNKAHFFFASERMHMHEKKVCTLNTCARAQLTEQECACVCVHSEVCMKLVEMYSA